MKSIYIRLFQADVSCSEMVFFYFEGKWFILKAVKNRETNVLSNLNDTDNVHRQ